MTNGENIYTTENLILMNNLYYELLYERTYQRDFCYTYLHACRTPEAIVSFFNGRYANVGDIFYNLNFTNINETLAAGLSSIYSSNIFRVASDFMKFNDTPGHEYFITNTTRMRFRYGYPVRGFTSAYENRAEQDAAISAYVSTKVRNILDPIAQDGLGRMSVTYSHPLFSDIVIDDALRYDTSLFIIIGICGCVAVVIRTRSLLMTCTGTIHFFSQLFLANIFYNIVAGYHYFGCAHVVMAAVLILLYCQEFLQYLAAWNRFKPGSSTGIALLGQRFTAASQSSSYTAFVGSLACALLFFLSPVALVSTVGLFFLISAPLVYLTGLIFLPCTIYAYSQHLIYDIPCAMKEILCCFCYIQEINPKLKRLASAHKTRRKVVPSHALKSSLQARDQNASVPSDDDSRHSSDRHHGSLPRGYPTDEERKLFGIAPSDNPKPHDALRRRLREERRRSRDERRGSREERRRSRDERRGSSEERRGSRDDRRGSRDNSDDDRTSSRFKHSSSSIDDRNSSRDKRALVNRDNHSSSRDDDSSSHLNSTPSPYGNLRTPSSDERSSPQSRRRRSSGSRNSQDDRTSPERRTRKMTSAVLVEKIGKARRRTIKSDRMSKVPFDDNNNANNNNHSMNNNAIADGQSISASGDARRALAASSSVDKKPAAAVKQSPAVIADAAAGPGCGSRLNDFYRKTINKYVNFLRWRFCDKVVCGWCVVTLLLLLTVPLIVSAVYLKAEKSPVSE